MARDTLEINLWEPEVECSVCGAWCAWRWSLPVDDCGGLVPNDVPEWAGGIACCEGCYEAHAEGLLAEDNRQAWRRRRWLIRRAMTAAFRREG